MKIKLYWLRFKSKTPKALKDLQGLLAAIAVSSGAAIGIMAQFEIDEPKLLNIFKYLAVAAAFAIPILQFATSDKNIQKIDTDED